MAIVTTNVVHVKVMALQMAPETVTAMLMLDAVLGKLVLQAVIMLVVLL